MIDLAIQNAIGLLVLFVGILNAPRIVGNAPINEKRYPQNPLSPFGWIVLCGFVVGAVYWITFINTPPHVNHW